MQQQQLALVVLLRTLDRRLFIHHSPIILVSHYVSLSAIYFVSYWMRHVASSSPSFRCKSFRTRRISTATFIPLVPFYFDAVRVDCFVDQRRDFYTSCRIVAYLANNSKGRLVLVWFSLVGWHIHPFSALPPPLLAILPHFSVMYSSVSIEMKQWSVLLVRLSLPDDFGNWRLEYLLILLLPPLPLCCLSASHSSLWWIDSGNWKNRKLSSQTHTRASMWGRKWGGEGGRRCIIQLQLYMSILALRTAETAVVMSTGRRTCWTLREQQIRRKEMHKKRDDGWWVSFK